MTLLDYGAGNVRSIRNAITRLGWSIVDVQQPRDISSARRLIFPGVGSFAAAMQHLAKKEVSTPRARRRPTQQQPVLPSHSVVRL